MRLLNASLPSSSPWAAALLCVLLGLLTAAPLGMLFGDAPGAWLWGLLLGFALWLSLLWLISTAILPPVRVDTATRTLRVRGREYSAAHLRRATRSISANANAAYLTYRFTLEDGRRFRLVAVGRPFRGLTPEGLRDLRLLVEGSSIAEPEELTPDQQRLSSALQANSRAVPVGRTAILSDIDELLGVTPTTSAESPSPAAPAPRLPHDQESLIAEDIEAADAIRSRAATLFRVQRIAAVTGIVGAVLLILLVVSFVIDEWVDLPAWSPEHGAVGMVAYPGFVLSILGGVIWMLSADAAVRRVRRLADDRWASFDETARARGLPTPYVVVDATGARRTSAVVAFVSLVLAAVSILFTVGAAIVVEDELRPTFVVVGVIAAIALMGLTFFCWRAHRRDARMTAERLALRVGDRFGMF